MQWVYTGSQPPMQAKEKIPQRWSSSAYLERREHLFTSRSALGPHPHMLYRKGGRNHERNWCIPRIPVFCTKAKVAKGGAYLQNTTVHVMYILWYCTSCLCAGGLYGYLSQSGCAENDPSYRLYPEERSIAGLWWWGQEEKETTSHKTVRPRCYK